MTNKLVVIINSLKVPKIKKILLYEMKCLVPNYSCLQNPWLGGYRPQVPVLSALCPQLNLLNPLSPKKIPGYATGIAHCEKISSYEHGMVTQLELFEYSNNKDTVNGNGEREIICCEFNLNLMFNWHICCTKMTFFFNSKFPTTHANNNVSPHTTSFKVHWGWLWDFSTVIPRLTKIIRSGITFVSRNLR